MLSDLALIFAIVLIVITVAILMKICETKGLCLCLACPKLSKIKPVQVHPLPNDGIPLADEIRLANIV